MTAPENDTIEAKVMRLYGDHINEYARGSEVMERSAKDVCVPAIVAISLAEEYASIVLTSRMDAELRKLLERMLHRQGKAEKLLFEYNCPFGTFSSKIEASYSFGFLTKKMHDALTSCRKIRNAFAHSDNPDAAKDSKDYKRFKPRLLNCNTAYTSECIDKLTQLRTCCGEDEDHLPPFSDVVAVMLETTETLGRTAFGALPAQSNKRCFPCAYFGIADLPDVDSMTPYC
jgi:Domain of unknown function (DUF4145)